MLFPVERVGWVDREVGGNGLLGKSVGVARRVEG